jgi:hypothetical protein
MIEGPAIAETEFENGPAQVIEIGRYRVENITLGRQAADETVQATHDRYAVSVCLSPLNTVLAIKSITLSCGAMVAFPGAFRDDAVVV